MEGERERERERKKREREIERVGKERRNMRKEYVCVHVCNIHAYIHTATLYKTCINTTLYSIHTYMYTHTRTV